MAAYHTQQINVGSIQAPEVGSIFNDLADRLSKNYQQGLQNTKTGAELARAQILNQRADEKYARDMQEQQAADVYNAEIAKGAQVKGGVLNTEALIKESDKYGLTPQEIEDSKTYMDEASARAAGKTALADKLAWQNKLSNAANQIAESGIAKESRPEMYERAMEGVRGKGLPVLAPMVTSLDQARLAEIEAENAKVKDLDSRIADVRKDEVSNARWAINAQGNGSNVTDADGNVIGTTAGTTAGIKRNIKLDDKYDDKVGKGERDILESVKKLKVGDSGLAGEDALKLYREILKDPTVDPESAAAAVTQGIGTKEDAWYNPFDSATGTFKRGAVDALTPLLKGTRTPDVVGGTGSVGVGYSTKANEARDLAKLVGDQNEATLAQLKSDKAKLLAGEDSRRAGRVDDALRSVGVLPSAKAETPENKAAAKRSGKLEVSGKSSKDVGFLQAVADVESSGGDYTAYSDKSSAKGKYQFVDSTLKSLIKSSGNTHTVDQVYNSPDLQEYYMGKLIEDNKKTLTGMKVPVNDFNMWLAHNLSPDSAKEFLSGEPLSDKTVYKIKQNLPEGFAPTRENYLARYGKKFDGAPTSIKEKSAEEVANDTSKPSDRIARLIANSDDGTTTDRNVIAEYDKIVSDKKDKINELTTKAKALTADVSSGRTGAIDDLKSTNLEIAKLQSDINSIKPPTLVKAPAEDVTKINPLTAHRNYLIAKRVGEFEGKSAEDWYKEMSGIGKASVFAPAAPLVAAATPLIIAGLTGALGSSAIPEVLPQVTNDVGRVISGGSRQAILSDMYIPKIQSLVSKPLTAEIRAELLSIAQKVPGDIRKGIIQYLQRAEKLGK